MNEPVRKSPALALVLGFLPAMLVLGIGTIGGQNGPPRGVLWSVFAFSVACCFASSFLLFRRRTGWAVAGGTLLLLLNGVISLFVGCVAVFQGT